MPWKEFFEALGATPLLLGILLIFWKGDEALSTQFKLDLSQWLQSLRATGNEKYWIDIVVYQFSRIFGENHFSKKCIFSSAVLSFAFSSVIATSILIENRVDFSIFSFFIEESTIIEIISGFSVVIFIIFSFLFVNVISDYLSLCETRFILYYLKNYKFNYLIFFVIDVILSTLIVLNIFYIFLFLIHKITGISIDDEYRNYFYFFAQVYEDIFNKKTDGTTWFGIEMSGAGAVVLISVATTFLTSVWILAAGLGCLIIRSASKLNSGLRVMRYALPIDTHPVRSVGITLSAILLIPIVLKAAFLG